MIQVIRVVVAGLAITATVPSGQPTTAAPPSIVVGRVDLATAKTNRAAIESGMLGGGTVKLPAGEITLDAALQLGPRHSGGTLQGLGPHTILRNAHFTGNGANGTLSVSGLGVPYIVNSSLAPDGGALILDPNIVGTGLPWDHPIAQVGILRPGNVVYAFAYDSYMTQNPPPRKRFTVRSSAASTRRLTLDTVPDPSLLTLKWMDGSPIADVREGDRIVRLLDPGTAPTYPAGRYVFVTDGPSLANGAKGEHRRVLACDPALGVVTLDQAVTRPYTLATLARIDPAAGITVKNLTIGQPANPEALCQVDTTCDLTFERVFFHTPADPGQSPVGLNSCGRILFKECTVWGGLQLNACHDIVVDGGVLVSLMGEEGSTNCTVQNATIRHDPRRAGQAFNGVGWAVGSDRLTLVKSRIEGYGAPIPAGGSMSPILAEGRGIVLRDVTVSNSVGTPGCWLNSEGGQIVRLRSDAPVFLTGGTKWQLQGSSAPSWNLRAGTSGTVAGCRPLPAAAPGWTIRP